MFYQRAYSVKKEDILKMFLLGGLLFSIIPLSLSLLGFVGAAMVEGGTLVIDKPEMVGPEVIGHFLPAWAFGLFVLLAFAGLASTLDSAFCAISSLVSIDIYRRYIKPTASDHESLQAARIGMITLGFFGVFIALMEPDLIWVFNFYAAVAVGGLAPVLLVLAGFKPKSTSVVVSVIVALAIALPSSIYGNLHENYFFIVGGPIVALIISTAICVFSIVKKEPTYG
jgi:Na+/proline symporter